MRKKVPKRRRGKPPVLSVCKVDEVPADTGTSSVDGPRSLGDPMPFSQFPKCRKCEAEGDATITVAYQREYDVLMCSCVKCGFQWDMYPKDKSGLNQPPPSGR